MAKYLTKSHLIHNGVMNKPGSAVDLKDAEQIQRLIVLGAIEPEPIASKKKAEPKAPEAPQEGTDGNPGE